MSNKLREENKKLRDENDSLRDEVLDIKQGLHDERSHQARPENASSKIFMPNQPPPREQERLSTPTYKPAE